MDNWLINNGCKNCFHIDKMNMKRDEFFDGWKSETIINILYKCQICKNEWHKQKINLSRGIKILSPDKSIFNLWEVKYCCYYTGETTHFAGYLFLEKPSEEIFKFQNKYDYQSAKKCYELLTEYRKNKMAFFHTDCLPLRQMALHCCGKFD